MCNCTSENPSGRTASGGMDSGLAPRGAPRNDERLNHLAFFTSAASHAMRVARNDEETSDGYRVFQNATTRWAVAGIRRA